MGLTAFSYARRGSRDMKTHFYEKLLYIKISRDKRNFICYE